jgi:hypothetical protein
MDSGQGREPLTVLSVGRLPDGQRRLTETTAAVTTNPGIIRNSQRAQYPSLVDGNVHAGKLHSTPD